MSQTETGLKIPPYSIEAEQAVLGGVMLDNPSWDKIADKLTGRDFYRSEHRFIFQALAVLTEDHKPLDVITVSEFLAASNQLEEVGGLAYVGQLAKNTPTAANIVAYADIVRERSVLRQMVSVATDIADSGFDPQGRKATELLDEAEQKIFAISESSARHLSSQGPRPLSEVLATTVGRIEELQNSDSELIGVPTGFADFDRLTAGLQAEDLIIVAGRPSMGKTIFGMNIAEKVSMTTDKPVLVFSMEMPAEQIAMRLLSSMGRVEFQLLRTGQINEGDWPRLSSAMSMLSARKVYIDDTSAMTPVEIRSRARRVKREHGDLGLIVIDYLQLMRVPGASEHRAAEISEISRSLKALARELNVPVVALSQLNRGLETRPDRRPMMSDLRESGAIEQDADLIVFIYRDEVYNKESPDKGTAEIIIGKQRNGPIGMVRLTFLGQFMRFDNFSMRTPESLPPSAPPSPQVRGEVQHGQSYSSVT